MAKWVAIVLVLWLLVLAAHRFRRVLVMGGAVATSMGVLGFLTNA